MSFTFKPLINILISLLCYLIIPIIKLLIHQQIVGLYAFYIKNNKISLWFLSSL